MNKSQPADKEIAFGIELFKVSVASCNSLINSVEVEGCLTLNRVTNDSIAAIGMVISESSSKKFK